MRRLQYLILAGIAILHSGCFVVYHTGMEFVFDGVSLEANQEILDIPYSELGETEMKHRLDLFLPDVGRNWPLLVFVHGGGWSSGDKGLKFGGKEVYRNIGRYYASRGFASAVINYRLLPGVHWTTQIDDVASAVSWLQNNIQSFGGDPNSIFLSGHSAGSQLAAWVAMNDDLQHEYSIAPGSIRGVIAVSGAGYDMTDEKTNRSGTMMRYLKDRFELVDDGTTWPEEASPIRFASRDDPPFLILVGGKEPNELIRQSELLQATLDSVGVPAEMSVLRGRRHARMILMLSQRNGEASLAVEKFIADAMQQTSEQHISSRTNSR